MAHNMFRSDVLKVGRMIKEDRTSLEAQLRYYKYITTNISMELGFIDRKIYELEKERQRKVKQFEQAPQKIKELELRLKGLDKKQSVMLNEPRIKQIRRLRLQLVRLEGK